MDKTKAPSQDVRDKTAELHRAGMGDKGYRASSMKTSFPQQEHLIGVLGVLQYHNDPKTYYRGHKGASQHELY